MAFKVGSIFADTKINTKGWQQGLKSLTKSAAVAAGALATTVGTALVAATKKGNEFQISMKNINSIVDETIINTQQLTLALFKLDPALGDTTELTDGLYQAFSSGAEDAEEALEITTTSAKFAQGAITDVSTAVDAVTTATNAYGKENVTAQQAADLFFATVKDGKITGDQLASTIGQSIPLFASTGIELKELTAGMAAMTLQGVNASEATTQLNAIVNGFLKPSEGMTIALDKMGIASGAAFLEAKGLTGALEFLENVTGGNADAMAELMPNIRGMRGAMALTGEGGEAFTRILGDMEKSVVTVDDAFKEQEKTYAKFRNSINTNMILIGNISKSLSDDFVDGLTDVNVQIKEFLLSERGMRTVSTAVATIAASFETTKKVLEPLTSTVFVQFKDLLGTVGQLTVQLTGNTNDAFNGLNLMVRVVESLTNTFKLLVLPIKGNIETITNLLTLIREGADVVGAFFSFIKGDTSLKELRAQLSEAGGAAVQLGTDFVQTGGELITTLFDVINPFGDGVRTQAVQIEETWRQSFNSVKQNVSDSYTELLTGQKDFNEQQQQTQQLGNVATVEEDSNKNQTLIEQQKDTTNTLSNLWKTHWEQEKLNISDFVDTSLNMLNEFLNSASTIFNLVNDIREQELDLFLQSQQLRIDELSADHKEEIRLLRIRTEQEQEINRRLQEDGFIDKVEARRRNRDLRLDMNEEIRLIEIEHNKKLEEINQESLERENAIKKKQFEANKKLSIANVWIDSASAIMTYWAQSAKLGPVAGPIFAGIMTALTTGTAVAQTALISQQQFVPAFQSGGTMRGNGPARINEQGGEIVTLPDGTVVIPNDLSRVIMNNASRGDQSFKIVINNPMFSDERMIDSLTNKIVKKIGREMRIAI